VSQYIIFLKDWLVITFRKYFFMTKDNLAGTLCTFKEQSNILYSKLN